MQSAAERSPRIQDVGDEAVAAGSAKITGHGTGDIADTDADGTAGLADGTPGTADPGEKSANSLVFCLNPIRDLRELTPGGGRGGWCRTRGVTNVEAVASTE